MFTQTGTHMDMNCLESYSCYIFLSVFVFVHRIFTFFLMRLYMLMDILRSILNEQVRHMFDEIDYIREGKNAERFASLYGDDLRVFISPFLLMCR